MNYFDVLFAKKQSGGGETPTLITKTITVNGTYNASEDNADGYSQVTVNVPLPQNAKLITSAENYPITDSADYPLPKCEVTVTNADKCEVIVTSDNTITENNAPYLYRATPSGNKVLNELVGGTVAWNQLVQNGDFNDSSNWTLTSGATISVGNNIASVTLSNQASSCIYQPINNIVNHKYLIMADVKSSDISFVKIYWGGIVKDSIPISSAWTTISTIYNSSGGLYFSLRKGSTIETTASGVLSERNVHIHDLTQMFGTTIADYIYSLEQATAGSGIALLKSYGFLTEDYYPYNAGELMSVKTSARKVYDSDSNLLATYPLSNIELRGIPKLVNNQLVYDGDRYEGNGRVTRKYGIVDLGGLTWSYDSGNALFISKLNDAKVINYSKGVICICDKYLTTGDISISWSTFPDKYISAGNNYSASYNLAVKDTAYTDAVTFKTAMSGVYLIYELATPTEEQTSPYDNPQLAGSTEEFVDTREVAIPVGHESKYFNGEGYITYLDPNTSDTIDMAQEHAIMPLETTYISANGTLDVEYWK